MATQAGSITSRQERAANRNPKDQEAPHDNRLSTLIFTTLWFGIVAGLVEGAEFLAFQHINWAAWAKQMHVAKQIVWISPIVTLCFFIPVAFLIIIGSRIVSRLTERTSSLQVLVFVLGFLSVYDWLRVTNRLQRNACVLLALGIATVLLRWLRTHEESSAKVFRRSTPWLLVSFALIIAGMEGGMRLHEDYATYRLVTAQGNSPNVLVIVFDTLRADHVSSYGYGRPTSPEIDRLAQHGVLFENAIAASSWSLPSHASLLTGRAVHEHGWGSVRQIPWLGWGDSALNRLPTLGEALQQRGYRTVAFSANSVYFTSNVGLGRGFLHFEDYFENAGDAFVRTEFGREFSRRYMNRSPKSLFTRGFRALGLGTWLDKDSEGSGTYGGTFGVRKRADEVNAETLRWIQRDTKHPFFAFLNYFDVHYAYGGPKDDPKPAWDHGSTMDLYDAGLHYADDRLGQLLNRLNELGILKNTIVIITSDHGESLGDHGLHYHGASLYKEVIQVPLVISFPGHVPDGIRVEHPVSTDSIAATVMDLTGKGESFFPGPSLAELWQKPSSAQNWPDAISELPQTNNLTPDDRAMQDKEPIASNGSMRSVFTARWQLIQHDKWSDQIYEWQADSQESKNLINTPQGRAARDEILARLKP
jgi:arylsulfatase A-like enzyme